MAQLSFAKKASFLAMERTQASLTWSHTQQASFEPFGYLPFDISRHWRRAFFTAAVQLLGYFQVIVLPSSTRIHLELMVSTKYSVLFWQLCLCHSFIREWQASQHLLNSFLYALQEQLQQNNSRLAIMCVQLVEMGRGPFNLIPILLFFTVQHQPIESVDPCLYITINVYRCRLTSSGLLLPG